MREYTVQSIQENRTRDLECVVLKPAFASVQSRIVLKHEPETVSFSKVMPIVQTEKQKNEPDADALLVKLLLGFIIVLLSALFI